MESELETSKARILSSAKKEFLEKGFMNASLRTIAANAGLTTGAMYRSFKDKDALFCALVDKAIDAVYAALSKNDLEFHKSFSSPLENEHFDSEKETAHSFVEYIYSDFDAFTLLFTKAAGSTHENFVQEIADKYTELCIEIFSWAQKAYKFSKKIDKMTIHVFATSFVTSFVEIVLHKMKKKDALHLIDNVQEFNHYGFLHLLGLPCS